MRGPLTRLRTPLATTRRLSRLPPGDGADGCSALGGAEFGGLQLRRVQLPLVHGPRSASAQGRLAPHWAHKRRIDSYLHAAEAPWPVGQCMPRLRSQGKRSSLPARQPRDKPGRRRARAARAADGHASGGASSPVVTEWAKGAPAAACPRLQRQRQAQATEQDTSKRVVLKPELVASRQRGSGNATASNLARDAGSSSVKSVSRALRSKWAQAACCQPRAVSPKYRGWLARSSSASAAHGGTANTAVRNTSSARAAPRIERACWVGICARVRG